MDKAKPRMQPAMGLGVDSHPTSDSPSNDFDSLIYSRDASTQRIKRWGQAAIAIALIASIEYFLLGWEFGNKAGNYLNQNESCTSESCTNALKVIFALGSYISNASMTVLINKEMFENFAASAFYQRHDKRSTSQKMASGAILFHAFVTAFSITGTLFRSLGNTALWWKILLAIPAFLSNLSIFYYTEKELLENIYNNFFDESATIKTRKNVAKKLDLIRNYVIRVDESKWEPLKTQLTANNIDHFIRTDLEILAKNSPAIVDEPIDCKNIFWQIVGIIIGGLSVAAYYNVGVSVMEIFCPDENSCEESAKNGLSTFFGLFCFSSYLMFGMDLTRDAFDTFYNRLNNKTSSLLEPASTSKKFVYALLFLGCILSTPPNVNVTIDYLQENIKLGWLVFLAINAGIGVLITNGKWFVDLVDKIHVHAHIQQYSAKISHCLYTTFTRRQSELTLANTDIVKEKHKTISFIDQLKSNLLTYDSQNIYHLFSKTDIRSSSHQSDDAPAQHLVASATALSS